MTGILAKIVELLIRYLVIPLFSKLVVEIIAYFQAKKEEADRNKKIDESVEKFKNATDAKEKEEAFLDLVRHRSK